jgi:hypothetical protein
VPIEDTTNVEMAVIGRMLTGIVERADISGNIRIFKTQSTPSKGEESVVQYHIRCRFRNYFINTSGTTLMSALEKALQKLTI